MAIVLALSALLAAGGEQGDRFAGRPLADALQMLQQRGLPIVYSSAVVTAAMVVSAEPRATDRRRLRDELLRPHQLEAKPGPGGILQIVRAPNKRPTRRDAVTRREPSDAALTDDASTRLAFDERVIVVARADDARARGAVAEARVSGEELRARASVLANDALAALHAVPRVAATSDFRSEFSVRGSGPRHLAVVIDGIAASAMRHAMSGMRESAVLAMMSPEVVDRAVLQVGGRRHRSSALGRSRATRTRVLFRSIVSSVRSRRV
jgi:hypothetical protein